EREAREGPAVTVRRMSSVADAGGGAGAAASETLSSQAEARPSVAVGLPVKIAIAVSFVAIAAIGTLNAWNYPARDGYDFGAHWKYSQLLIHHGRFPSQGPASEYYTPPGYYAIAGAVVWVGQKAGMHHPVRLAQQLNVFFVLGTALLVLLTARLLFPR